GLRPGLIEPAFQAESGASRIDVRYFLEGITAMKIPDILSETEEGFADLVFAITSAHEEDDGSRVFVAEAVHERGHVALQIELSASWSPRRQGGISYHAGTVT